MYKQGLALNNLQKLICRKTQPINRLTIAESHYSLLVKWYLQNAIYKISWGQSPWPNY